jgi:hypothetical protein
MPKARRAHDGLDVPAAPAEPTAEPTAETPDLAILKAKAKLLVMLLRPGRI